MADLADGPAGSISKTCLHFFDCLLFDASFQAQAAASPQMLDVWLDVLTAHSKLMKQACLASFNWHV